MASSLVVSVAVAIVIALLTYGGQQLYSQAFPFHLLTAHKHSRPQVLTKSFEGRTVLVTGAHGAYGSRAAKLFKDADTLILVGAKAGPVKQGFLLFCLQLRMLIST